LSFAFFLLLNGFDSVLIHEHFSVHVIRLIVDEVDLLNAAICPKEVKTLITVCPNLDRDKNT
jgi:hypothetical protein